jgi:hypothetical protein
LRQGVGRYWKIDHAVTTLNGGVKMYFLRSLLKGAFVTSIVGMAAIAPSSSVEAGDRTLKANQVRALFPGNYEARVRGYKIAVVAKRNGSLAGAAFNRTDKGRWWTKGNQLCIAWASWTDGRPTCGRIKRSGSWYVSQNVSGSTMKFRRD